MGAATPDERFKPGDRIWYKKTNYPELWEQGLFIKATPSGSQPIIRQMPNDSTKEADAAFDRVSEEGINALPLVDAREGISDGPGNWIDEAGIGTD